MEASNANRKRPAGKTKGGITGVPFLDARRGLIPKFREAGHQPAVQLTLEWADNVVSDPAKQGLHKKGVFDACPLTWGEWPDEFSHWLGLHGDV